MFPTRTSDAARPAGIPQKPIGRQRSAREEGFTLAGLIVILTILAVVVAYTVPDQWSLVMQRERDRQTIWQMKQYARAILRFQQKHKTLPTSLKQLHDAREPRMVRGEEVMICALTGEQDWILVPPQAVTLPGLPGAAGPGGFPPGVPTTTIQQGRGAIVVPITDPRVNQRPGSSPVAGGGAVSPPTGTPGVPLPGAEAGGSKLNPELSPDDYKEGPFVSVRPRKKGASILALNEVEDYGQWVYTYQDVMNEVQRRIQTLYKK